MAIERHSYNVPFGRSSVAKVFVRVSYLRGYFVLIGSMMSVDRQMHESQRELSNPPAASSPDRLI
jgi:hypothetical protein